MNQPWLKRASALLMSAAMAASILPTGALAAAETQADADAAASSAYTESADSARNSSTPAGNNATAAAAGADTAAAPADGDATQNGSGSGENQTVSESVTQESAEQTEAVDAPAEPESFGGLWLTEINPNDYDGYNKGKYGLTKAEDFFEYVELRNNSDQR